MVFDETDYADALEAVEPMSDLVIQHEDGSEDPGLETVEERLISDLGNAIAAYIQTPGSVLYQPESDG